VLFLSEESFVFFVCSFVLFVTFLAPSSVLRSEGSSGLPVLLGIFHTGDKKLAVTNLSSEGRVLERFHHLLALLIVD